MPQMINYQILALRTASISNLDDPILGATLGLTDEVGEIAKHIKDHYFQEHKIDPNYLIKELGDILWYVALMCEGLSVTMDEVANKNIEKLRDRYPDGFSSERSINRKEFLYGSKEDDNRIVTEGPSNETDGTIVRTDNKNITSDHNANEPRQSHK